MSAYAGPETSTNGLVFAYDMGNTVNSWRGSPTINLIGNPFCLGNTGPTIAFSGYEASVSVVPAFTAEMQRISPFWLKYVKTSSTNGRVWFLNNVGTLDIGVDYTYSVYVYTEDTRITGFNLGSDNGAVSGTTQVLSSWATSDNGNIKRMAAIFRSLNGSQVQGCRISATDPIGCTFYMAAFQCEKNSIATPVVEGTRSNTQAILDLTRRNTITASNLTYNNNGSFSWSSNIDARLQSPSSSNFAFGTGDFTIECSIYPNSISGYQHMIALPSQDVFALKANINDGDIYFYSPSYTTYGSTPGWTLTLNRWNHVCFARASSVGYAYLNGTLTGFKSGFTNNFTSQILNIGNGYPNEWLPKQIDQVKIYNRALTAAEIRQNFEATRGRYGI